MIKSILKKILSQKGYKIVPIAEEKTDKNVQTLAETIVLARNSALPNLPVQGNEKRISLINNLIGTNPTEGLYIIDSIAKTAALDGDVCEFGVAQGATSALIGNEIKDSTKNFWLFDSFKGLPKPTEKDQLCDDIFNLGDINAYEGSMAFDVFKVKDRLQSVQFPENRVKIVSGFIEETIKFSNLPTKVSFAYVDFDFYEPIVIALDFLHKVMPVGGMIIVDDYDFFSTGAKSATDEFVAAHAYEYQIFVPQKELGHFAVLKRIN